MAIEFIPLDYMNDGRIGKKARGEDMGAWPELDVFGNEYVRPATTMGLPNNPGYFVVIPNGFSGERTVELRQMLKDAPPVQEVSVATPISEAEAASMPEAELEIQYPIESNVPTQGSVDEESFP